MDSGQAGELEAVMSGGSRAEVLPQMATADGRSQIGAD